MTSGINRRNVLVGAAATAVALPSFVRNSNAAAADTHTVTIKSFEFVPQHIVVKVGDTISWTNEDIAPHTATALQGGWDTGEIVKGDTQSVTVSADMETDYFCAFHPHMKATIEII